MISFASGAVSDRPEGPFIPEPKPIVGSYSIDTVYFRDDAGSFYLYFGGIWGGQLRIAAGILRSVGRASQRAGNGRFTASGTHG